MTPNKIQNSVKPLNKMPTGIPGLDDITNGGLPRGRSALVSGTSGSAKTILSVQFLYAGATVYKEAGVFVTMEETPEDIKKNVKSFGWDLDALEKNGKLAFVDISPTPGETSQEVGAYDFSALLARIEYAVKKVNAQRLSIDSIGSLFSRFANETLVRAELYRISAGLKRLGVSGLITAERAKETGVISRFGIEEFVVDNVIVLRNSLEDERRRRTIEVLKFRGADHQKGEFPFTLSPDGVEVLPLSSMELTQKSTSKRISTGNKVLDRMCGGGFYRDSIILISGATGCGKTLGVTTFLDDGSKKGEKTLVFAFEESREQLLRNAIGWGMNFQQWEEKGLLKIICNYPEVLGLEDHLLNIKREIEKFNPSRIAVDSLSALERVSSGKSFREFVISLTSFIKARQSAGLFTATTDSLMGGTSVTEAHISTITDSILLLRYVELMGEMRRGITVLKMRGSMHDKSIREYTIDGKGMHIGHAFKNIGGILAGNPIQMLVGESERLKDMFVDNPGDGAG